MLFSRNRKCPCESGKKYADCCMHEAMAVMNACAGLPIHEMNSTPDPLPNLDFEFIKNDIIHGRILEARVKARECVGQYPESARAHYLKGVCLAKLEKLSEALSFLQRAIELSPRFAEAQFSLGNVYRELYEFEKALVHYHTALNLSLRDSDFGRLIMHEVESVSQSIRQKSGANAYVSLANKRTFDRASAAISRGEYEVAIALMQKVLKFDRNHHGALLNLGLLHAAIGNIEKALDYISRTLQVSPDDALACRSREEILKLKDGERFQFPFDLVVTQYYKMGA